MTDEPVELDGHRDVAGRMATEVRRQRVHEFRARQAALGRRQRQLENLLQSAPAETWREVAAKAQYLIQLLANSPEGEDPRRRTLIAQTLSDLSRLCKREETEQ